MSAPPDTPPPAAGDPGRPLLVEVAVPVALGLLVVIAALGVTLSALADRDASALLALPVAIVLVAGLGGWVAWVLRDTALGPLRRLEAGLRGLEAGDFAARVPAEGAREFRALAMSFNRSVTILGHHRERLKLLAASDPLTGLANHRTVHERLRAEIERVGRDGGGLGVVVLDLDGFRSVNDERGHARGDEVLKAVAGALTGVVREGDLAARLSGDDFVLVLPGVEAADIRTFADRAREAVGRAVPSDLRLTASAGYVAFPSQASGEADLVELASAAVAVAKRDGGARTQRYDAAHVTASPTLRAERLEIEALLRTEDPIEPVFQPIVELRSGRLVGYEALARFPGQDRRTPDAFFNQAARVGLGPQLEARAVQAALRASRRPEGTYLSLNLTPSAISSSMVRSSLPDDLSAVVVEITEHELAPEDGALEEGLADLRSRGARIAIDDAGAGYAGLQTVMRVQPDLIKLDRSLVSSVDSDSARAALIEFFVVFARRIEADVCCEGIETAEELTALARLGVRLGQGYLLGRPSEPWSPIAPAAATAIARLRTSAPAKAAATGGAPQLSGPVNRRLTRAARH